MLGAALAGCLALSGSALLPIADARDAPAVVDSPEVPQGDLGQHLAVVVPVYRGDLSRAVSSLERWPSTCSPLTERNADLVLYYAEGEEDAPAVEAAVETINETAGSCFSRTRLVYAHLSDEEDVYPKGPSVMFFKMFLDQDVHSHLSEYDALAIIEWDVLVASDRSFEELHHAAFRGNEDFWVKGSNLGGTNFHSTAQASEMWNVLGHINGNAIYNNNDPAFVEYVDYTRTRWEYTYPYDVALWLTISDFPYSWPLWQRYSSKFVTTNLISYVGYEHVDHSTVSDAVAGQTLFIHGSRVDEGNLASLKSILKAKEGDRYVRTPALATGRRLSAETPAVCHDTCGSADTAGLPPGTSTVCDNTCAGDSARFGGFLCGAGDSDKFGFMCRLCYTDADEARREEQSLALARPEGDQEASHVIMCDTMRPPDAADCSDKCGRKDDTVCDEACGTGLHGDYNCNWRNHGEKCRFCFDDLKTALLADNVAKRRGGRVIMCSTFEPPQAEVVPVKSQTKVSTSRKLQAWKENEKWKTTTKWQTSEKWKNPDDDEEPKWRQNEKWKNVDDDTPKWRETEKWKNNFCDEDDCPHTNSNGIRGRVCDYSCADGVPYGTFGCGARDGAYGDYCRVCYFDQDTAIANDSADERAIMCDTVMPVEGGVYRRLAATTAVEGENASEVAENLTALKGTRSDGKRENRKLQAWKENEKWKTTTKWQTSEKWKNPDDDEEPKWRQNEKWKNVDDDTPKWRETEKWKNNFCDEDDCPHTNSNGIRGRVCDYSCADGDPYGTFGCGARDGAYGDYCRVCYFDQDTAIANDSADERAIMCDTVMPVEGGVYRRLTATAAVEGDKASDVAENLKSWKDSHADGKLKRRKLQAWKENEKWKTTTKWQTSEKWKNPDDDEEPKWRQNEKWKNVDDDTPKWRETEKWKNNFCDEDDCPHTNSNGIRGRVCDYSCADGDPYGTFGCGARDGAYGDYCRVCYFDQDTAIANDSADERAIMCDTVLPVEGGVYRRLAATTDTEGENAENVGKELKALKGSRTAGKKAGKKAQRKRKHRKLQNNAVINAQTMFAQATVLPYMKDLLRGNLCAFVAGHLDEVDQVEVAVMSVLQFLPGMRVAVAADDAGFDAYDRAVGALPGVTVHSTKDPFTASLFADEFCGADTKLIFYMKPGSIVSRQFMSKDTHSTHGDLLVVHGNAKASFDDRQLAKQTTAVLGFEAPSFTFNTDLFLPVGANAELRKVLASGEGQTDVLESIENVTKLRNMSAVPQVMAALAYSRNTPGVWFVDPQTWVSQHLFKAASIWEIPLVKPHFTCSIDQAVMKTDAGNMNVGLILQSNLDFFTHGGTCDNGFIDVGRGA